ncbi:MAG: DUF2007 domain-containing protein [Bacteroidetes bacterium]|nr:DUF2007 domain-containing protein [Bacteroidota bacterium]
MDGNWVKIYTTTEGYKAEIIKGMLLQHGIESIIINKKDSAYLFGELELYVSSDFAIKANRLVNEQKEI